jgi:hypothetical protein
MNVQKAKRKNELKPREMDKQIENVLIELCGRSGAHFIAEYFRRIEQPFTVSRFKKITHDELIDGWVSMNTAIRIQKTQILIEQSTID